MISDSQRLASFEDEMKKMRVAFGEDWDPLFIWEPEPVRLSAHRHLNAT